MFTLTTEKFRKLQWPEHAARVGETNSYRIVVDKCFGNDPLGILRRRWEGNIKMDHKVVGCEDGRC